MHDTLAYLREDPVHRRYHHDRMTFAVYAFSERFVLPLSHDEVVHGKARSSRRCRATRGSGSRRCARFGFMWAHPGKKLLFMGSEFAQWAEFAHDATPHWDLLDAPAHRGARLVRDLNRTYAAEPALHALDCHAAGFSWLIGDDRDNSVFAFARRDDAGPGGRRLQLHAGAARELSRRPARARTVARTDEHRCRAVRRHQRRQRRRRVAEAVPAHGEAWSATLRLPPLATLWLRPI